MTDYWMDEGDDLVIHERHWDNVEQWIQRMSDYTYEEQKDTVVPFRRRKRKPFNPNRKTKQQVVDAKRQRGNFKLRIFD
jgi:hypothetical protein